MDVNLTPLQPHHKIEKSEKQKKKKNIQCQHDSQNVGLDSTTRKSPQVLHPGDFTQQLPLFLNGE